MELQQFVSESLRQIMAGIVDAQKAVEDIGGLIAPSNSDYQYDKAGTRYVQPPGRDKPPREMTVIDFDVAVTVTEGSQSKGGVGVVMAVLALGGSRQSEATAESVSRIKFGVPVSLPTHPPKPEAPSLP